MWYEKQKKNYCLRFLPSTVLWKRGEKGALLSCWTWYSCGEEFPKSMQQKNYCCTLIVFIGKTSSSPHKKNEKNQQWIYSNITLFLLLSFSLLRVLPEQKPLEIEFWQSKDAISAGMASSSKHSATPLPNDWAL